MAASYVALCVSCTVVDSPPNCARICPRYRWRRPIVAYAHTRPPARTRWLLAAARDVSVGAAVRRTSTDDTL